MTPEESSDIEESDEQLDEPFLKDDPYERSLMILIQGLYRLNCTLFEVSVFFFEICF